MCYILWFFTVVFIYTKYFSMLCVIYCGVLLLFLFTLDNSLSCASKFDDPVRAFRAGCYV